MRPTAEVLVVGDALLDVSVAPSGPMRSGGDIPAAVYLGLGGQGANVAVRMARRGVRVRLACSLGDDSAGRIIREALGAEGIDLDAAPADGTGAVVILVGPDGERSMLSRRAPLLPLTVDAARLTVISGYVLLEQGEIALRPGARVAVLGCALPEGSVGLWWRRVDTLSPLVTILNSDELRALGGDAQFLADVGVVVVTEPIGATASFPDREAPRRQTLAHPREPVDTTGAGDAFAAAFLGELLDLPTWASSDVDRALSAGLELAAQVAGVSGAQTAVPLEQQKTRA